MTCNVQFRSTYYFAKVRVRVRGDQFPGNRVPNRVFGEGTSVPGE